MSHHQLQDTKLLTAYSSNFWKFTDGNLACAAPEYGGNIFILSIPVTVSAYATPS